MIDEREFLGLPTSSGIAWQNLARRPDYRPTALDEPKALWRRAKHAAAMVKAK